MQPTTPTRTPIDAPASMSSSIISSGNYSPAQTPEKQRVSDRYIPDRRSQDAEMSHFVLTWKENRTPPSLLMNTPPSCTDEPYAAALARQLFPNSMSSSVLGLNAMEEMPHSEANRFSSCPGVVYNENRARQFKSRSFRVIPQTPERILDAPELIDDFYLNLIDWSSQNVLTVALSQTVYLWNADSGDIQQLMTTDDRDNCVTSVSWHPNGSTLALGTNDSEVQLWDTAAQKLIRTVTGHTSRVGSLAWNNHMLASGSRDATVRLHDIRAPQSLAVLGNTHTQEVCGLRWNPNGTQLASGGNDNLVNIWDFRRELLDCRPALQLKAHVAAIKALAWNPCQHNLLVSGGGTADKTLRFWNTSTGECLHTIDTKSQVCGVMWSRSGTELVSSHGYSDNQLTLWKYPSLKRITDLTGHSSRVLHLTMSPDGQIVVSAAGDETIRFWRCFGSDSRGAKPIRQQSPVNEWGESASSFANHLR